MPNRPSRRKAKPVPGAIRHFPTAPGWWVQWSGRTDWHPMSETEGPLMQKILAGDGDRLVRIAKPEETAVPQ